MDDDLVRTLTGAAGAVFAETPIFLAYAYGSRVCGYPRHASDLDVGYYLPGDRAGHRLSLYEEMILEDKLSRTTGYEVDLRNLGDAPLELRGRVLEEGARIYCSDERARIALESHLLSRYHDYKPTLGAMHARRLAVFAEESQTP